MHAGLNSDYAKETKEIIDTINETNEHEEVDCTKRTKIDNLTELFFDDYVDVLDIAKKICIERGASYNNNDTQMQDYFPLGLPSYFQMMHLKYMRIKSLLNEPDRLDDLQDSLIDLINYTAFMTIEARKEADK